MSEIKLVVTDVDGTLVSSFGTRPTERVRQAIARIQASGRNIVIASARPVEMAESLIEHIGLQGLQIVDGGASIYDFSTGEYVWKNWIQYDTLMRIVKVIVGEAVVIDCFPTFHMVQIQEFNIASVVDPAPYVYVKIPIGAHESIWRQLKEIPDIAYHVVDLETGFEHVQVNDLRATKQHGLAELQRRLGVDKTQTLAIGDMDNDLSLFALADNRVAMQNASDDLKANATYVTGHVRDDGWATAMEYFGL